jgi:glycosyltransferase involved in cell wall biosynthesis
MRILMIANSLNYVMHGGLSRHTYEVCRNLRGLGLKVFVCCMDEPENHEIVFDNIISIPCVSFPLLDLLSFNFSMLEVVRKYGIDIVHSQDSYGFIFALAKNRPLIVTVHGSNVRIMKSVKEQLHHITPYLMLPIEKLALIKADKIIAVSRSVAKAIQVDYGIDEEKITCIPNGVDTDTFRPNVDGKRVRLEYDINGPMLLCVTRLQPDRYIQYLIPSIQDVVRQIPDTKLIIVGEGPLKPHLKSQCDHYGLTNNVVLAGPRDVDLPNFYAAADLYVLPGVHPPATKEMTVLEAMACGKPVVYIERYRSAVEEEYHANIIGTNDKNFANTIVSLLQDNKKRKQLGLMAVNDARENFSWKKNAYDTVQLYKSLL